MELLKKV
jgi:hypothetical protein